MTKYLGAGLIAVDHIFLSKNDKKRPRKYDYLGSSGGGTVGNVLCMLSLLDHESSIFGIVGNDLGERIIKEDFLSFNINYDFLIKRGDRNNIITTRQFSHRILQNGKHYFDKKCLECGIKFTTDYQMTKKDISKKLHKYASDKHLIIDRANLTTLKLAQNAKQNNQKVIYNFDFSIYGKYNTNNENMLGICNILKTNDKEIKKFLGVNEGVTDIIFEKYPSIDHLFVTNGIKGVYGYSKYKDKEIVFKEPPITCKKIRDTSGAGDVFLASIISHLLGNDQPKDETQLLYSINKAQALAALNCTLYGARSLQHFILKEGFTSKDIDEMSKDIINIGIVNNPFSAHIGLSNNSSKPYRLSKLNSCKICGNFSLQRKEKISKTQKRRKKSTLHKSLESAPWTMITSYNIGKAKRESFNKIIKKGAYFVGSGGSLSAAIFAETIILRYHNKLAKAITPYEFESYNSIDTEIPVILISHGGNNTDILGAALWANKSLKISSGFCLLGNKNSTLSNIAKENTWNCVYIPSKERNFVSLVGYLSQVAAFCGLLAPDHLLVELDQFFSETQLIPFFSFFNRKMASLASRIAPNEKAMEQKHLIGLARGWGWPALIDFESKIVEGGVCTIEISELKNYTHGRYLNSFGAYNRKNRHALIYCMPEDNEIASFLSYKFGKYIKNDIIRTEREGILGSLELIIQSIFLAWYVGQIAKKNILKPIFPREARGLYGWEPEWRKNEWK